MIDNVTMYYEQSGVSVELTTKTNDENAPYHLAEMFARVIRDVNVTPEVLLESLKAELNA